MTIIVPRRSLGHTQIVSAVSAWCFQLDFNLNVGTQSLAKSEAAPVGGGRFRTQNRGLGEFTNGFFRWLYHLQMKYLPRYHDLFYMHLTEIKYMHHHGLYRGGATYKTPDLG